MLSQRTGSLLVQANTGSLENGLILHKWPRGGLLGLCQQLKRDLVCPNSIPPRVQHLTLLFPLYELDLLLRPPLSTMLQLALGFLALG